MVEYLKKYKELLEQLEINKNKIQENEQLLNKNHERWQESKEKIDNLDLELQELEKEYNNLMNKKYNKLYNTLELIQTILSISILILLYISNPLWFLLGLPIILTYNMIVFLAIFIISKCTNVFDKIFNKDKNINSLVQRITNKEKALSEAKAKCDEYRQNIIKYRKQLKQLDNEKTNNCNSINELMVNYATPIFDEQLKNIQEEQKDRPLTKTKKPDHQKI